MRHKVKRFATVTGVVVVGYLVIIGLWSFGVGPGLPSKDELPELPSDVAVVGSDESCGPSNCGRSVTVISDGESGEALARRLSGVVDEGCSVRGILDFRRKCTGVIAREDRVEVFVTIEGVL
ncbi:hypothetical protein [Nocardioides zeae]|uniref:Uncharacterized protein n=1 Tax=Nocardioides zeae TaxID=1457234 RepID=A0A6P0HKB2_9ACTN|nr:hypothetical protein [Nocardioides zeae]NEN78674.1 hypothetical protein [Nocardioides zeae]